MPRSDFEITDNWHVMGLAGTGSCDVVVDPVVPAHRVHSITGTGSPSATQIQVAESAADLDAARLSLTRNFSDLMAAAIQRSFPAEMLARVDRDRVLASRHAVAATDRVFANTGARALSLDSPIQRAWRDVHAGAAHPASVPEIPLAAYGAQAFGLITPSH